MLIHPDLLLTWGANIVKVRKNHVFFNQGDEPRYFFQIVKGSVRVININKEGKEYIQGVFSDGDSFGEPPLMIQQPYPSYAISAGQTIVLKLAKERFFQILDENSAIQRDFLNILCWRIYNKSVKSSEVINNPAEIRVLNFLSHLAADRGSQKTPSFKVPYTRQQIADSTGLRVETVIRIVKLLESKKKLIILNGKIYI